MRLWTEPSSACIETAANDSDACVTYCITVHEWTHSNDRRKWRSSWTDDEIAVFPESPGYEAELRCLRSFPSLAVFSAVVASPSRLRTAVAAVSARCAGAVRS